MLAFLFHRRKHLRAAGRILKIKNDAGLHVYTEVNLVSSLPKFS